MSGPIEQAAWQAIDLSRYPLHQQDDAAYASLVAVCRRRLAVDGLFDLSGFLLPSAVAACVERLQPRFAADGFRHAREHNIYFSDDPPELPPDHPALTRLQTSNLTLCGDQLFDTCLPAVYGCRALWRFLAAVLGKARLYPLDDPLACANVMAYGAGEALNWHFDRAEFTTTLLLQNPHRGGEFQYRSGLRSDEDPAYDAVGRLLRGLDPALKSVSLQPGTLSVFKGRHTAHRVTSVGGGRSRIVAVFSYVEAPDVSFTPAERIGFYGRAL